MSRIHRQGDFPDEDADADVENVIAGHNTIVTPHKSKYNTNNRKKSYSLASGQRKKLVKQQLAGFVDVLKVHCLLDGCQHVWIQECLAMRYILPTSNSNIPSYGGTCTVCSGLWNTILLPVDKDSVVIWLNSGSVRGAFPMDATISSNYSGK